MLTISIKKTYSGNVKIALAGYVKFTCRKQVLFNQGSSSNLALNLSKFEQIDWFVFPPENIGKPIGQLKVV